LTFFPNRSLQVLQGPAFARQKARGRGTDPVKEEGESAGASDGEGLGEGPADKTIDCAGDDTLDDALDAALNTADEADADGESEWDGDGAIRCEGTTGLSHESVSRVCLSIARTCLGSCCVRADFAPILGPW